MKRNLAASAVLVLASMAAAAVAGAAEHGSAGLASVTVTVTNTGTEAITCGAAVAHWFAVDLGRADAGASVGIPLFVDARTGTQYLLNAKADRLPVEALWCGLAGRAWATRAMIGPPRRAGTQPAAFAISCSPADGRLRCR